MSEPVVNWDNVSKTLAILKAETELEFDMEKILVRKVEEENESYGSVCITPINAAARPCGTAGCLIGFASIAAVLDKEYQSQYPSINLSSTRVGMNYLVEDMGNQYLYLYSIPDSNYPLIHIADHIQLGWWSPNGLKASKDEAIQYLEKALLEKNLLVRL